MGRDFLFTFMYNYFKNDFGRTDEICAMLHDGFSEEYIRLFDWFIGKYYKRGKEQLEVAPYYLRKYKGIALLYNFDLFEYVQNRYDILTKPCGFQICYCEEGSKYGVRHYLTRLSDSTKAKVLENLMNTDVVKYVPNYRFYELLNLLSIFRYFNIQRGVDQVNKMIYGSQIEFKERVETRYDYKESASHFQICYSKIQPVRYGMGNGKFKYDHLDIEYEGRIDLGYYFDTYRSAHKDKIDTEIAKINELLQSIT